MSADRRIDPALRERLDEIQAEYRRLAERNWGAIRQLTHRTYTILAVVAVVSFVSGAASLHLIGQDTKRGHEAAKLGHEIQQQRIAATLWACRDQNRRHDRTIRRLDIAIRRLPDLVERQRAKRQRASTVSLLSALAPHRDCARVVRVIVPNGR